MRKNSRNNERETDASTGINGYELKNPEVRREKERRNIMDQRKNTENGFNENGFNTVEEALEDLRQGKLILVTDDPAREK